MDEITRDSIVSIAAFAAIFGIAYVYFVTRHRERMTMMDKGVDLQTFQSKPQTLKFGMLAIGVAAGILAGAAFRQVGLEKNTSYLSMVFLCSGISLVLYHLITRKQSS